MVDVVATRKGLTVAAVEDGMTLRQIELSYHFAQRERMREIRLYQAATRGAIIEAIHGVKG